MSQLVLLDTGPLGMVTHPRASPINDQCNHWLETLLLKGTQIVVPEIADYELRRELVRAKKLSGLKRLDDLKNRIGYIPLTTQTMLQAVEFWAYARNIGRPTAQDAALDGDVILAAQATVLMNYGYETVIATTNVRHLELFVKAQLWHEIN